MGKIIVGKSDKILTMGIYLPLERQVGLGGGTAVEQLQFPTYENNI